MEEAKKTGTRFIGIDLGKRAYEMAIVDEKGNVKMSGGKTFIEARQGLYRKLRPGDKVALEAGNMAFLMAKEIEAAVGCKVYVLNASRLALIYGSMKKTDKEDSLKLAHIIQDFSEERLPTVPLPSDREMNRRKLVAGSRRAQQDRTRKLCQLHGLFLAQGITTVKKADLATSCNRREAAKALSGYDLKEAEYLLACLEKNEGRIKELDRLIEEEAAGDGQIERLESIPGVGPKTAFAFAAHVAAERFENGGQVSNYIGMVPRVYMSGQTVRYGKITKRGNGYLRALLVQAAWALVRSRNGGKLKERFIYMTVEKSIGKKKAIVAVARRIAEMMYTLMRDKSWHANRPFAKGGREAEKLAQLA